MELPGPRELAGKRKELSAWHTGSQTPVTQFAPWHRSGNARGVLQSVKGHWKSACSGSRAHNLQSGQGNTRWVQGNPSGGPNTGHRTVKPWTKQRLKHLFVNSVHSVHISAWLLGLGDSGTFPSPWDNSAAGHKWQGSINSTWWRFVFSLFWKKKQLELNCEHTPFYHRALARASFKHLPHYKYCTLQFSY